MLGLSALSELALSELPAAGGGTPALTGVAATGAVGTQLPQIAVPLTGVAATGAVGTQLPQIATPLTGVAATGAVGSAAPVLTVALTGIVATGAVGTMTAPAGDITLPISGVGATGAVGALTPTLITALSGVAGTAAVGTLQPVTARDVTGVQGSVGQGTLLPSSSTSLTGVVATGAVGDLTAPGDVTVALTGVGAVGAVGSLLPQAVSGAASGVTRQWLVEYYTKAWERKPAEVPPAPPRKGRRKPATPVTVGVYPDTLEQVEELVQRAEVAVRKTAQQLKNTETVDALVAQAQRYAVESTLPVMDFGPLLARYMAEATAKRQQQEDEDDLTLFALVL